MMGIESLARLTFILYLSYYDKIHHCSVPHSGQRLRLQTCFWSTQPRCVTNTISWSLKLYIWCVKLMAGYFCKSCRHKHWRQKSAYYGSTWLKCNAINSLTRLTIKCWYYIWHKPWKALGCKGWNQCSNCRVGCSRMIWKRRIWHRNSWALKLKPSLRGCAYHLNWCLHSLNERWKERWTRHKYTVRVREPFHLYFFIFLPMYAPNKVFKRTLRIDFKAVLHTTQLRILPQVTFFRWEKSVSLDIGWLVFAVEFDFYFSK